MTWHSGSSIFNASVIIASSSFRALSTFALIEKILHIHIVSNEVERGNFTVAELVEGDRCFCLDVMLVDI